jgi:hypothetical protein
VEKKNYEIYKQKKSSYEPIIGCKHPIIASGLLPPGALNAHPIIK